MATLQAAEMAGMGLKHQVKLISEPEAAAVYTFKAIQPTQFKVGDNFVVCDAGECASGVSLTETQLKRVVQVEAPWI